VTTIRFYIAWFRLGRSYWKAQQEIRKLEEDCLRWATLAAYLDHPSGSVADEVAAWLADHEDDQ